MSGFMQPFVCKVHDARQRTSMGVMAHPSAKVSERGESCKCRSCSLCCFPLHSAWTTLGCDTHSCALRSEAAIMHDRNSQGQQDGPGQRCPAPRGHVPPAPGLNRDVSTANGHEGWWGACV